MLVAQMMSVGLFLLLLAALWLDDLRRKRVAKLQLRRTVERQVGDVLRECGWSVAPSRKG